MKCKNLPDNKNKKLKIKEQSSELSSPSKVEFYLTVQCILRVCNGTYSVFINKRCTGSSLVEEVLEAGHSKMALRLHTNKYFIPARNSTLHFTSNFCEFAGLVF